MKKRQVFVMDGDHENFLELKRPTRAFNALMCLMAMYYVFDFEFPKECKGSYTFIQEYVLSDINGKSRSRNYTKNIYKKSKQLFVFCKFQVLKSRTCKLQRKMCYYKIQPLNKVQGFHNF